MFNVEISVVIPCFNVSGYIDECMQCVLSQTKLPLQIICVDDNSTDNTREILASYAERYPDLISLLSNREKKGAPGSRNTGLAACKGNYVQFLDADDILFPIKFEHHAKLMSAAEGKTDILVGSFSKKFMNGTEKIYLNKKNDPWVALIDNKIGVTTGNLFKKSKLEEINGWNAELKSSQEYELMFRLLKKNAVVQFDEVMVSFNRERSSGSITQSNPKEKWKRYIDLRIEIFNFLQSNNLLNKERENTFYANMLNSIRSLYKFDKATAISLNLQYLQGKNLPLNDQPMNRLYVFLYNRFGFSVAQELSKLVSIGKLMES